MTTTADKCRPAHFHTNTGNGTFADRAKEAGLSSQLGGLNIVQGDYNNDGCPDILVLRGGWEGCRSASRCSGTTATARSPT